MIKLPFVKPEQSEIQFSVGTCWLGNILVARSNSGICAIFLGDHRNGLIDDLQHRFSHSIIIEENDSWATIMDQVLEFVEAADHDWTLPLDLRGTEFQRLVWAELRKIPSGSTVSYSEIADRIDRPKAVRAVASACGANPISVVIPCHRVVGKSGALSGYRWGLNRKEKLLTRERQLINIDRP
jgi:AraC family transcriptional regulator of adaptative response/methylated-DNA-[protein]-cysteine methyltransferase